MGRGSAKKGGKIVRPAKTPRYCQGFVDRHGRPRWYYRRKGFPKVPLPGLPWSPEFMEAYQAAVEDAPRIKAGEKRVKPGTIDDLVVRYYSTSWWKNGIKDSTRDVYRNIIERFREKHGHKRVAKIRHYHVTAILEAKSETPAAANRLRKILNKMFKFAVTERMMTANPLSDVEPLAQKRTGGFKTWDEESIAIFENYHPIGSRARLAMALMLFTAQRRSDAVRMGPQHVRGGAITVRQTKTGAECVIPIHRELRHIIDATPSGHLSFVVTHRGAPFSVGGFSKVFREYVRAAGLPDGLSPHGLRKAACCRLAEAGCTAPEIMAISGHRDIREVERYIKEANQKRLAQSAMRALESAKTDAEVSNLEKRLDKTA